MVTKIHMTGLPFFFGGGTITIGGGENGGGGGAEGGVFDGPLGSEGGKLGGTELSMSAQTKLPGLIGQV
jgi:hypothetical protein